MRNFEVILCNDSLLAQRYIPDRDPAFGVTSEESASITELKAVRMDLIKDSAFHS